MAVQSDSGGKDDVKTQFVTREGTYRLMTLSEYSRPNRVGYTSAGASHVRVSLVSLPAPPAPSAAPQTAPQAAPDEGSDGDSPPPPADDRICFNHGKELYVYVYRGVKKAADLTKPVDKKIYKGTNPTCHDFNGAAAAHDSAPLLIGFSTGQIQLVDPLRKELCKLYNEERLIDKTRVTCIRWVPGSASLFVAAHASGQLYVYSEELPAAAPPPYALQLSGDGYSVHACRAKQPRNPLYRWVMGAGAGEGACINEFSFSPCGARLAVASQDGWLRVFQYGSMALLGRARSYFGAFLCASWAPDGRYVAVGGQDDLLTVWSLAERRVVARARGHRSWVSVVAFDPFAAEPGAEPPAYRLGSVAQDTQLCLWDLSEDVLRPAARPRASAHLSPGAAPPAAPSPAPAPAPTPAAELNGAPAARVPRNKPKVAHKLAELPAAGAGEPAGGGGGALGVGSLTQRLAGFSFGERRAEQRRAPAAPGREPRRAPADDARLVGTPACPRFDECPLLEPLVCKKIAHERLTALLFRKDYFLTACADGCVNTWARPARAGGAGGARRERPDSAD